MRPADKAWMALAVAVFAYEARAAGRPGWELLSEAADRHRSRHPLIVHSAVIYLALHLLRAWPARLDPLHRLARWIAEN